MKWEFRGIIWTGELQGGIGYGGLLRTDPKVPSACSTQVWMDLAEKVTGPLEEALTVAFSQVQPSPAPPSRRDGGVPEDRVIYMSLSWTWIPSLCQLCNSDLSLVTLASVSTLSAFLRVGGRI